MVESSPTNLPRRRGWLRGLLLTVLALLALLVLTGLLLFASVHTNKGSNWWW